MKKQQEKYHKTHAHSFLLSEQVKLDLRDHQANGVGRDRWAPGERLDHQVLDLKVGRVNLKLNPGKIQYACFNSNMELGLTGSQGEPGPPGQAGPAGLTGPKGKVHTPPRGLVGVTFLWYCYSRGRRLKTLVTHD